MMEQNGNSERRSFFKDSRWEQASISLADVDQPLVRLLAQTESKPDLAVAQCVREKTLETLIALHFESLAGLRPVTIVTSRAMVSDPDVIVVDELGRVHVVETKKAALNEKDVQQAEQYMLRFVFSDPQMFLGRWSECYDSRRSSLEDAIVGLWADRDYTKEAKGTLGELTELQAICVGRILERHAWLRRPSPSEWSALPYSKPRLVLWLASPRITDGAFKRIRDLRRLGVDVRALELRARLHPDAAKLALWVRREASAPRDHVEQDVSRLAQDCPVETRTGGGTIAEERSMVLSWELHRHKRPSDRRVAEDEPGHLPGDSALHWTPNAKAVIASDHGAPREMVFSKYCPLAVTAGLLGITMFRAEEELRRLVGVLQGLDWRSQMVSASPWNQRLHVMPEDRWGRTGIGLFGSASSSWRPGVFVGFLYDGTDHGVMPSTPRGGIDLSVILDADRRTHKGQKDYSSWLREQVAYCQLVERLRKEMPAWHIADTFGDPNGNHWHPLHLRTPLVPLLRQGDAHVANVAVQGVLSLLAGDSLLP